MHKKYNMTVISANLGDIDNKYNHYLWEGIDCKVIELTPSSTDWEQMVDEAIANETDTLIFVGHGSPHGLYFPTRMFDEYVLHENNVHLIKAKKVICIWCYASSFCQQHNLNAFASSMFISNSNEAESCLGMLSHQEDVTSVQNQIIREINYMLKNGVPLDDYVMRLGARMDCENPIDTFNRQGFIYIKNE